LQVEETTVALMNSILFICTGNYYRSRFAEIVFNDIAKREKIAAVAFSRGFRLNPAKNSGALSPHAVSYLSLLRISFGHPGEPTRLTTADLNGASCIVVLDEKEHRPMMRQSFPDWEDKVQYWNFEDDYLVSPANVLPALKEKVLDLATSLANETPQAHSAKAQRRE
jgi:protein-tyrosine phosphatase